VLESKVTNSRFR